MANKKSDKEIVFQRAPFAQEIFTEDGTKKFNNLNGWVRQIVKRTVESGDLKRAIKEAGDLSDLPALPQETSMKKALLDQGIDATSLVCDLKECLEATYVSKDKHGNFVEAKDLKLKLKAVDMVMKIMGAYDDKEQPKIASEELFKNIKMTDE